MRNGRQQGESVVGIAESLYACRVSEGGNNVLGDNAEAAVSVGQGAVNLPETGFNGDGAQLLTLVIEQERLSAVFGSAAVCRVNGTAGSIKKTPNRRGPGGGSRRHWRGGTNRTTA